jgi:hypothetical protein
MRGVRFLSIARYYFNFFDTANAHVSDTKGTELQSLDAARDEAGYALMGLASDIKPMALTGNCSSRSAIPKVARFGMCRSSSRCSRRPKPGAIAAVPLPR